MTMTISMLETVLPVIETTMTATTTMVVCCVYGTLDAEALIGGI